MHSTTKKSQQSRGVIECYREFLPVSPVTPIISLGEGNTPMIYSSRLSERVGRCCEVFVKNEGVNPTGSFKDRGMTMAVSKAIECGTKALICASTGNTSASAAAYAARAGISCVVILPAGKIATGKLLQAFAYGAKIVAIDANFDDALRIVRELGATGDFTIVNSVNPDRIAGQKTAAFEIIDEFGDAPDFHLLPVGNAGNITAYWAGYREYLGGERSTKLPSMIGFQAIGAAPIFYDHVIEKPETIASAANPAPLTTLTEDEILFRDNIRQFAQDRVRPCAGVDPCEHVSRHAGPHAREREQQHDLSDPRQKTGNRLANAKHR